MSMKPYITGELADAAPPNKNALRFCTANAEPILTLHHDGTYTVHGSIEKLVKSENPICRALGKLLEDTFHSGEACGSNQGGR